MNDQPQTDGTPRPRVILLTGKGGVGKTTVAAATGLAAAREGKRTVVISLDAAHSLADSFDLPVSLYDKHHGQPIRINDRLDIQEIDVQEEIGRYWGDVQEYVGELMSTSGLEDIVAEELAVIPGMDDVVGLLYLNQYARKDEYDVIVLDCAPTGESLRFVSMPQTLEWYMEKLFKIERAFMKAVRPVAEKITGVPMPKDKVYASIENLFDKLVGVDKLLLDNTRTTVRLVTNAEKMVVAETQRAFMYFTLYHMSVDAVVVNRLFPTDADGGYYAKWVETQKHHAARVVELFAPVPVVKLRLFDDEVLGTERLLRLADELFEGWSPVGIWHTAQPYEFVKDGDGARLVIELPFATKDEVELYKEHDMLIVRVANFKRYVPLPRAVARSEPAGARIVDGKLVVRFEE